MYKIPIYDLSFYPDPSSSKYHKSKKIEWDRTGTKGPLTFFTDLALPLATSNIFNNTKRVAWLLEPLAINSGPYKYVFEYPDLFDLVLTHQKPIIEKHPKAVYYPSYMSWIDEKDFNVYPKTKGISILASGKKQTVGHKLRHDFISKKPDNVDIYGYGYNPVEHKISALKDYMFSVTIENSRVNGYFTEKLIDCFLTGTVPIYWGDPDIGEHFDRSGIIVVNDEDELNAFVGNLDNVNRVGLYNSMQQPIKKNFETAKECIVAEDYIFDKILKPMGLV